MRSLRHHILLIPVFCVLGFPGCKQDPGTSPPRSAAPVTIPTAGEMKEIPDYPRMTIENPTVAFGRMNDFETRTATVRFRNGGGKPLQVKKVEAACGCTSVGFDTSKIYAPDETGEIVLSFTPKGQGSQTKTVSVISTDPDEPLQTISITADIQPSLSAVPRILQLGRIPYGQASVANTTITALQPGIRLDTVKLSGDVGNGVTAELVPIDPASNGMPRWRVDVAFGQAHRWGWFAGSMIVSGKIEFEAETRPVKMNFAVNGSSEGTVVTEDSMFRFLMVQSSTDIDRSVDLRRSDGGVFRCLDATVVGGGSEGLTARLIPLDSQGIAWRVDLRGRSPGKPGSFLGEVFVRTDVAGEETIRLKYGGVVRR